MSNSVLYRLGGIALILAGLAYITDTVIDFLLPENMYGVGMLVSLLGLYGMTALFLFQNEKGGVVGLLAYIFNFTGLSGLVAIAFFNNLVKNKLEPDVIKLILSGEALAFFIAVGVVFLIGALLMGVTIWRVGKLPKVGALFYVAGAVPVAIPPLFPKLAVEAGGIGISLALIIWGSSLLYSLKQASIDYI